MSTLYLITGAAGYQRNRMAASNRKSAAWHFQGSVSVLSPLPIILRRFTDMFFEHRLEITL